MAQTRFIKFKDPITSFEANEKYTGIIEPTVYRGFDAVTARSGSNITIGHELTGELFTTKEGNLTPRRGVWVSKQGIVVKEDAPITVSLSSNASNNYERWDLLVAEHSYDELSIGGLPAVYTVIPGGNKIDPILTNSAYQIVIGRFKVPAGASGATGVTYERVRTPQLGGKFAAILKEINRYENQQQNNHGLAYLTNETLELPNRGVIKLLEAANTFAVYSEANAFLDLLPKLPNGTEINLVFLSNVTIRQRAEQMTSGGSPVVAGAASGYSPLSWATAQPTIRLEVKAGDAISLVKTENNDSWVITGVSSLVGTIQEQAANILSIISRVGTLESNYTTLNANLASHTGNTNNPHNVTKAQVGLGNLPNSKSDSTTTDDSNILATAKAVYDLRAAMTSLIGNHTTRQDNPHNVTKAQVGLSNIPNAISNDPNANSPATLATTALTFLLKQQIDAFVGVPSGTVVMWWGDQIPTGWAICDGTGGTPDLRGKVPMGMGPYTDYNGVTRDLSKGQIMGTYQHTLSQAELPNVRLKIFSNDVVSPDTSSNITSSGYVAKATTSSGTRDEKYATRAASAQPTMGNTSSMGSGNAHENMQPSFGIQFIMKL